MENIETVEEILIDEKIEEVDQEPEKFKIVFLNDNHTPMEWVVGLLVSVFHHSKETAEQIMLTIHNEGSGIVGIYTYEIAEQKALESTSMSRDNGFPLVVRMEKE